MNFKEYNNNLFVPNLYRGIPLDNKTGLKFVYGSLLTFECCPFPIGQNKINNMYFIVAREESGFADWGMPYPTKHYGVDEKAIDIFTGIFDYNEIPVFTSDYIKFVGSNEIYKVCYNKEFCCFEFKNDKELKGNFCENALSKFIVIGNVHYD